MYKVDNRTVEDDSAVLECIEGVPIPKSNDDETVIKFNIDQEVKQESGQSLSQVGLL